MIRNYASRDDVLRAFCHWKWTLVPWNTERKMKKMNPRKRCNQDLKEGVSWIARRDQLLNLARGFEINIPSRSTMLQRVCVALFLVSLLIPIVRRRSAMSSPCDWSCRRPNVLSIHLYSKSNEKGSKSYFRKYVNLLRVSKIDKYARFSCFTFYL